MVQNKQTEESEPKETTETDIDVQTHSFTYSRVHKNTKEGRQLWHKQLISALKRQRQADLCEFEVSLVYRASSRTASKAIEKPCLEKQKQNKTKQQKNLLTWKS